MSSLAPSLARLLDRSRALELVGIKFKDSRAVPLVDQCPICGAKELVVLPDFLNRAEWAACRRCRFSGDLIELIAKCSEVGIAAAVAILASEGAFLVKGAGQLDQQEVDAYLDQHIRRRENVKKLWAKAQEGFQKSDFEDLVGPLKTIGLRAGERSKFRSLSRWIGVLPKTQVEDLYCPRSYGKHGGETADGKTFIRSLYGPGESHMFPGRGWSNLLVVPAHDLPGRICGFLIIGRDGNPRTDIFFRSVHSLPTSLGTVESGLLLADGVYDEPERHLAAKWQALRLIGLDPIQVLQMQIRCFLSDHHVFPVAAIYQDDRYGPLHWWKTLSSQNLTYFADDPTRRVLSTALQCQGQVGGLPEKRAAFSSDRAYLNSMLTSRRPALEAAVEFLRQKPLHQIASGFAALPLAPEQQMKLLALLPSELQASVLQTGVRRTVRVHNRLIESREDELWDIGEKRRLINAHVEIEQICGTAAEGQIVFGTVRSGGRSLVYSLPGHEVADSGFLPTLKAYLSERGFCDLRYHTRAAEDIRGAIEAFRRPVRTLGRASVGWCAAAERFRFATCEVAPGRISIGSPLQGITELIPSQRWRLDRPLEELSAELHNLQGYEQVAFWGLFLIAVQQLVAPVLGWPKRGLLVQGSVAQEYLDHMAPEFGLLRPVYPDHLSSDDRVEWLTRQGAKHDLPPLLDLRNSRGRSGIERWFAELGERLGVLLVTEEMGPSLLSQGRFDQFQLPQRAKLPRNWRAPVLPAELLVLYLADLANRRFGLSNRGEVPLSRIIGDVSRWASDVGLVAESALKAVRRALTAREEVMPTAASAAPGLETEGDLKSKAPARKHKRPAKGNQPRANSSR
jgi:hypothetical protein